MQKDVDNRRTEVDKLRDEMEKKGLIPVGRGPPGEGQRPSSARCGTSWRLAEDLEGVAEEGAAGHAEDPAGSSPALIEKMGKSAGSC